MMRDDRWHSEYIEKMLATICRVLAWVVVEIFALSVMAQHLFFVPASEGVGIKTVLLLFLISVWRIHQNFVAYEITVKTYMAQHVVPWAKGTRSK